MKKYFHPFLFYNRGQRWGFLALSCLVLILWVIDWGYPRYKTAQATQNEVPWADDSLQQQVELFFKEMRTLPHTTRRKPTAPKQVAQRFPFNPNTADSTCFQQLGLPRWMIRNILRYRAKGGRFRQANDLKKMYGMNDTLYASLLPYIQIPPDTTHRPSQIRSSLLLASASDSTKYNKVEKYAPGTVIELNTADTTQLKKIPGIGSGLARQIVNYRHQLGGFYALKQLEDIHLNYRLLEAWLRIDTTQIQRIPVNKASVSQLHRHPYINFYQARYLVEYRKQKGPIRHLKPFVLLEEFPPEDLEKIRHYLDFTIF